MAEIDLHSDPEDDGLLTEHIAEAEADANLDALLQEMGVDNNFNEVKKKEKKKVAQEGASSVNKRSEILMAIIEKARDQTDYNVLI